MQHLEQLWRSVQWALETHGWKLLGAALLFYVGRGRYREFAARRHHEQTLAAANGSAFLLYLYVFGVYVAADPARVAVLQRETARVRHKQQQVLQAKSGSTKKAA